jgi:hypothetical protein
MISNVNEEGFLLMIGKGGMKRFIALMMMNMVIPVITFITVGGNNITLGSYGNLDPQSLVMIITPGFENDTRMDDIIDVKVNEKRC